MRDTLTPLLSADESGSAGRLRRSLFVGVFVALVVLALVVPPAAVGDGAAADEWPWEVQPGEDSDLFPLVGELTFRDDEGEEIKEPAFLGIDPGVHLAIFYVKKTDELRLVDTRTLEQLDLIDIPTAWVTDNPDKNRSMQFSVIDTENHRLFAPTLMEGHAPGEEAAAGVTDKRYCHPPPAGIVGFYACGGVTDTQPAIMTISLTGEHPPVVTPIELDLPPEASPHTTEVATKLAYHSPTDNVYAVTESQSGTRTDGTQYVENYTSLHELRAADLVASGADGAEAAWSYQLDECEFVGARNGGFLARSLRDAFVYLPCVSGSVGFGDNKVNTGMHGALRVDLNAGSDPSDTSQFETRFHPFAADLEDGSTVGDAVNDLLLLVQGMAGSKRLFVFDAYNEAWTGASAITESGNAAMPITNPATGRIYQWSGGGESGSWHGNWVPFMVTEGDRVEVPNGDTYNLGVVTARLRGGFDPSTRRLFVQRAVMCMQWADDGQCATPEEDYPHFRVFEDQLPDAPRPEPEDFDQYTEDVSDIDGPVFSSAGANATAYGARYLFAGGTQSSRPARDRSVQEAFREDSPLGPSSRNMVRAEVDEATLSRVTGTPTVVASAAGLTVGDQTGSDIKRNTEQNWPEDFPEEMRGYQAYCDDFGGEPAEDAKPGAAVSCDSLEPAGQAGALYTATDEQAPIQVGYAETSVEVREDDTSGSVATAIAVARDIDLFGQISIGEIRTEATAVAHGRPGTAATELTREYRQVRIGDSFACGWGKDDPCDIWEVARAINAVFQPRLVAYVPAQDTTLNPNASEEPDDQPGEARVSNGTPGGAKAGVTLDPYDAQSNETINEDKRTELPGLQIVYYDDHDAVSRHIFQFAAVELDVSHFLSAAPTFDPPDWANGDGGFGDGTGSGGGLPGDLGGAGLRQVTPPSITALGEEPVAPAEELELDSGGSAPPIGDAGEFEANDGTSGLEQGQAPSLGTAEGPAVDTGQDAPAPEVAPDASPDDQAVVAQGEQGGSSGPGGLMLTRQRMGETVPLAVLWVLAALPFYLAVRRRRLLTSSTR